MVSDQPATFLMGFLGRPAWTLACVIPLRRYYQPFTFIICFYFVYIFAQPNSLLDRRLIPRLVLSEEESRGELMDRNTLHEY